MTTETSLRLRYALSDYAMSFIGMLGFLYVRFNVTPIRALEQTYEGWVAWMHDWHVMWALLFIPAVVVLVSAISGYYNDVDLKSRLEDLRSSLVAAFCGTFLLYFVALIDDYIPVRRLNYELIGVLWLCLSLPLLCGRLIITRRQRRRIMRSDGLYRTLIIGTPDAVSRISKRLRPANSRAITVYNIVGSASPLRPDEIAKAIEELKPDVLVVTPHPEGIQASLDLITELYRTEISMCVSLELYRSITARTRFTNVVSEPLINITDASVPAATANIKRISDIFVSALALVILSPVYAAIALGVKLDSPGPVFYVQERIGRHKIPFNILKFRTMTVDAEDAGPSLSSDDDPRVTKFGRFLRKYRLDELPQFLNVLKGDMSLVGPRPERQFYAEQIIKRVPNYSLVHQVRPGITSWGMVKYGYASTVDEMVERVPYDLVYIENVSIGVDLKIMFHTIITVITGRGI